LGNAFSLNSNDPGGGGHYKSQRKTRKGFQVHFQSWQLTPYLNLGEKYFH